MNGNLYNICFFGVILFCHVAAEDLFFGFEHAMPNDEKIWKVDGRESVKLVDDEGMSVVNITDQSEQEITFLSAAIPDSFWKSDHPRFRLETRFKILELEGTFCITLYFQGVMPLYFSTNDSNNRSTVELSVYDHVKNIRHRIKKIPLNSYTNLVCRFEPNPNHDSGDESAGEVIIGESQDGGEIRMKMPRDGRSFSGKLKSIRLSSGSKPALRCSANVEFLKLFPTD